MGFTHDELTRLSHQLAGTRDSTMVLNRTRAMMHRLWQPQRLEWRLVEGGAGPSPAPEPWRAWLSGADLVMITRREGPRRHGWVVTRPTPRFTPADLHTADQLLPLLVLIDAWCIVPGRRLATARPQLTAREQQVLRLLAEGLKAEAIGRRLGISGLTVRKHLEHIYAKLDCHDRLLVPAQARERGLL